MIPAGLNVTRQPSLSHTALLEVPAPTWTQAMGLCSACCLLAPLSRGGDGHWHPHWPHKHLQRRGWRGCGYLPVQLAVALFLRQLCLAIKSSVSQVHLLTFSSLGGHFLLCIRAKSLSNLARNTIWWGRYLRVLVLVLLKCWVCSFFTQ